MQNLNKLIGSVAVASVIALAPFAASAHSLNASSTTAVVVNPHGIVRLLGAKVTAVSDGAVSASVTIGDTIMHWIIETTSTTKIRANGSKTASTTALKVGDRISVVGSFASAGTPLRIVATKIRDWTTFPKDHKDQKYHMEIRKNKGDKDD